MEIHIKKVIGKICHTFIVLYGMMSNISILFFQKPPEPEKKPLEKELDKKEVIEIRAPITGPQLPRPPFDSPLVTIKAQIAESLKNMIQQSIQKSEMEADG